MGREVKRVALDFDWPLSERWTGYVMPARLSSGTCTDCDGEGYSLRAQELRSMWHGSAPFRPEDNGSTPFTADTPSIWNKAKRFVEKRNPGNHPEFYDQTDHAIRREAQRLAEQHNQQWCHHLNQDDVDALIADGSRWIWAGATPREINEESVDNWAISTRHYPVIKARCAREGVPARCPSCDGKGYIEDYPGQEDDAEAWEGTDPPAGDGWQVWETVSEGSPITPVFSTPEDLARFIACPERSEKSQNWLSVMPYDNALRFVNTGWAPSAMSTPDGGIEPGYVVVGGQ